MPAVEERIDRLEIAIEEFVRNVGIEFNKLYNSQMRTEAELREFKEEMRASREESERDRKALHQEMTEFKDEMKEFKDEMREFKEEMKEDRKNMNKEWGRLANKMGTLVEDIIAPAARPVIKQYFKCEPNHRSVNVLKRIKDSDYEVDVIVACEDTVFMIEVKSTPKVNNVDEIIEKSKAFFEFNPEFMGKKLALILASLVFSEGVINYASKKGVYAMAYKEWEYMDILNFKEVRNEN